MTLSPPSSEMLVARANKMKSKNQTFVPKKAVLSAPFSLDWPVISDQEHDEVLAEIDRCATGILKNSRVQSNWKDLKKVDRSKRKEAKAKYEAEHLKSLSPSDLKDYQNAVAIREEKLSHIHLGYNNIMRQLEKGNVAALLVNKTVQPDFLPKTFLNACKSNKIPLVAVNRLDQCYRNSIAIGFKSSVLSPSCCFHPLYTKIIGTMREGLDSPLGASTTVGQAASPVKTSTQKKKKEGVPAVDVSKYHLTRDRQDQCAFIPGVGMNSRATMPDSDFIMIGKDDPLLDCPVELLTNFGSRERTKKVFKRKETSVNLYAKPSEENDSDAVKFKVNVKRQDSDSLFTLDVGGDDDSDRSEVAKRKCEDTDYSPALVNFFKANPKKNKDK